MIRNIDEINHAISELEERQTSMNNIEKLAMLYVVRENNQPKEAPMQYNRSAGNDSEFSKAAQAVPIDVLISVLDEHMADLKLLYPKTYAEILGKLR